MKKVIGIDIVEETWERYETCYKKLVHFIKKEYNKSDIDLVELNDIDEYGNQSDLSISNNRDMEKVLATVVRIRFEFFEFKPNGLIYFTGSDLIRTRLYRIAISNYVNEFRDLFVVYGILDKTTELFEPNRNYDAFLISWID